MSEPIILLSSKRISKMQLDDIVLSLGGNINLPHEKDGLSDGNRRIWISLNSSELEDIISTFGNNLESKLGNPAETLVLIEVSRNPGSMDLVKKLAQQLSESFPIVVYDCGDKIMSVSEFLSE